MSKFNGKILVTVASFNNGENAYKTLRMFPKSREYDVLVVNDGSTDDTLLHLKKFDFPVISHPVNRGVGAAIKTGIRYAHENGYFAMVVLAGNNKDNPQQVPLFLEAICQGYDYIQGSRFQKGGGFDNLPLFRYVMVKIHAFMFFLLTGFRGTDALNGFRAYRLDIFKDPRIDIEQEWLDHYEFETYLHYKVLKLKYKVKEVPVSKTYPRNKRKVKYTHIRPVLDWWVIMRPLILLFFRIKK